MKNFFYFGLLALTIFTTVFLGICRANAHRTVEPILGSVTVGPQTGNLCAGTAGSITFPVTVNRGTGSGSSGTFTASLGISANEEVIFPRGLSAHFMHLIDFTASDNSKTVTLTLNTTALTPAGTYTFRLLASRIYTYDFASAPLTFTVNAVPTCSITGADVVCPSSSNTYTAPAGMSSYSWTLTNANGATITSGANTQNVTVEAGSSCNTSFTLSSTITNANGCSSTCTKTVTVRPGALPTMTAPPAILAACGAIPASSTISFSNRLSGGCEIKGTSNRSTFSAMPGACGGEVTETFTATDACGRELAPVTRTIIVHPAALPTMTAPADITVNCDAIPASSTIAFSNGLTGSCQIKGISDKSTFSSMSGACGRTVTEIFTATDECGRKLAPVTRTITVRPAALPTMTAPEDITVNCGAIPALSTIAFSNGLTGSCQIKGPSNRSTFSAMPEACGGEVTETFTAADECGRALAAVTRTITVRPAALPTMTAPEDTTVDCGVLPAASTISFSNGLTGSCAITGTSDLSAFSFSRTSVNGTNPKPEVCGGKVAETFTATDACGRELAPVSRTITVRPAALPTMTAPANITVNCGALPAPSTISFSNGLTGRCAITGTSNASTFSTMPAACGGTVTETFTATDACGRELAPVTRTIIVRPAALPTMAAPADITVDCGALPAPSRIPFSNGATSSCAISGTSNPSTFSTPTSTCSGTVTETWTATDACGRTLASVSRTIHIEDNTTPTITTCPANKSVNANNAACSYIQLGTTWDATATDNCSSTNIKYTLSGATTSTANAYTTLNSVVFNGGTTTVSAMAKDACGNEATACTFTVTVTNSVTASCSTNNPELYFGYAGDQSAIITANGSGGTEPYTISFTLGRPLLLNQVNYAGDETLKVTGSNTVNATLLADAYIIATITDANGCTAKCSTFIHADDVRCFAGNSGNSKVTICHRTGSAKNPCVTICVDEDAVKEHLAHGDYLGKCNSTCTPPATTTAMKSTSGTTNTTDENAVKQLTVKVMPNPSATYFTLMLKSPKNDRVSMRIVDLTGRVIEQKQSVAPNGTTKLGANYFPGIFIAEFIQGKERVSVKLIKTYR